MYIRKQVFDGLGSESAFLWGARQTGKSTLLKYLYPEAKYIDLLLNEEYDRFLRNPGLLREIVAALPDGQIIIIDEIQKLPSLLDEVHWMIENLDKQFLLSGSSPRKIIREQFNLLGGRAFRYELYPLVSREIEDFNLIRALNNGLLPRHYLADEPERYLAAYTGNYLQDEIISEARLRNVSAFSRFLEVAALSNGELLNYSNIASECGVSSPTIQTYYRILDETLLGNFLPPFQKRPKRRVFLAPKFYFFDIGLVNYLLKRKDIQQGSEAFGNAFEHFVFMELKAYMHYSHKDFKLSYWRTTSGYEVDFILGDHEIALEVKSSSLAQSKHTRGLKAFNEEYSTKRNIIISTDQEARKIGNVEILPWKIFFDQLWDGKVI